MTGTAQRFRRAYFTIDIRTLGLARLCIGALLLFDLAKRAPEIEYWYTNDGLLPLQLLGEPPISAWNYGFMVLCGTSAEARLLFGAIAMVYLLFFVGFQTRFFHVASFVCLVSLQLRADLLSNGGDLVFCNLLLWTAFLPLGSSFSIDATRRRVAGESISSPVVSLAVLAVLLQLATIYYFSAVHKNGANWLEGTAVYYLAKQERMVTWFGLWLREHAPLFVFRVLTYSALLIEYALPVLILSPWGLPSTRRIAIAGIWALHCGIAAVANVGIFSVVMLSYSTLLVSVSDWEWLRTKVSDQFGEQHALTRALTLSPSSKIPSTGRRSATARARHGGAVLGLIVLMLVATSQVLVENRAVPKWLKPWQPEWAQTTVRLLRLGQGWRMFSPEAPRVEQHIVVDAVTLDGRRIDPFNRVASRLADPSVREIPVRVTQNYYWGDYTARLDGRRAHKLVFEKWVLRHHERTGRYEDFIDSFRAYIITQEHAAPGEIEPKSVLAKRVLYHR